MDEKIEPIVSITRTGIAVLLLLCGFSVEFCSGIVKPSIVFGMTSDCCLIALTALT